MKKLTARRRGLLGGAAVAAAGLAVVAGVMSPAHAKVDPKGTDARFVNLIYRGGCYNNGPNQPTGLNYHAEGYMVDDSGTTIENSTWHTWTGHLDCNDKVVFAWEPANKKARVFVVVTPAYDPQKKWLDKTIAGDQNLCAVSKADETFALNTSDVGGGGTAGCTSD